jgi:disulfide oxidoreductase YuzD
MQTKVCTKCGEVKSLDCFGKAKLGLFGLAAICKSCRKELCKKHYEENKEAILKRVKKYREKNKDIIAEYMKKHREENKESIAEQKKEYHQRLEVRVRRSLRNHNRRALLKKLKGTLSDTEWSKMLDHYNHTCPCCGKQTELTMDHVVPVSWHDQYPEHVTNDVKNHQPLCKSCNSSKRDHFSVQYLPANYFTDKVKLDFYCTTK